MTDTRVDLLQEALTLAMQVIESYQLDIRHAQETIGVDLLALGFCQGVVYDNALRRLAGIRLEAALVDDEELAEAAETPQEAAP